MKKKSTVVLGAILTVLMLVSGCGGNTGDEPTSTETTSTLISFQDIEGRHIHFMERPETFVVANYIANFMMVGGADSLDKVIGMTLDGWEDTRYGEYTVFTEAFPEMKDGENGMISTGGYHDNVLNTERIVSLEPDVVLMSPAQFVENNQNVRVLEQAGITVVVLDYHEQKLENHTKSTEILGLLLGREEIAEEQNTAYISAIEDVQERLAEIPEEEKQQTVYVELGNQGIGEYGNSYNNDMLWGAIVHNLEAVNMGAGIEGGYGVLDREFVITSDPDAIFIGGSIWSGDRNNDQMRMGFTVDEETAQERLSAFANRSDWQDMQAVQNGQIYGIDHGSLRNMIDYTYTQYMANVLYPEHFDDLDPVQTMHDYYETYLPELDGTGTFMMQWQPPDEENEQ